MAAEIAMVVVAEIFSSFFNPNHVRHVAIE